MPIKLTLFSLLLLAFATVAHAQLPAPTWELGKQAIDPSVCKGAVTLVDGVIKLDGTNAFTLPMNAIGKQIDYTIEFEIRRAPDAKGSVVLATTAADVSKTGMELKYFSPDYNAYWLSTNGNRTVEQRGLLDDKFNKLTIVSKDKKLTLFRNGLVLAMTGEVTPSGLPLTFGVVAKEPCTPVELRNIKVYDTALFPTGFDPTADTMRYYSGPGYAMQRVEIKDLKLPRILVVGDSISMGYRRYITEHFKGRAYVDYWVGGGWFEFDNKGTEFPAIQAWDNVMANGPYDVVSWNAMTLHMWNGSPGRCSEEKYPGYMTRMVEHLQTSFPKTKFIWIRCTPWRTTPKDGPVGLDPVHNDVIVKLNKLTDDIMIKHGVPEVDLYTFCLTKFDTIPNGSQDALHWPQEVAKQQADLINPVIDAQLPAKP